MELQEDGNSAATGAALQKAVHEVLSKVNWERPGAVELLHKQLREWTDFQTHSYDPSAQSVNVWPDVDLEGMLDMVGSAHVPIIGTDMDGIVQIWNSKAIDISGFLKNEAIGKNLVDWFIIDKFKDSVREVLSEACQGRDTVNFEFTMQSKSKNFFNMLLNVGARRDQAGEIIGVIAIGLSAERCSLTRINDTSGAEELANMIERGNAPIIGVNTAGIVTIWNQKAAFLSGYPKEEAIGKKLLNNFIRDQNKEDTWQVLLDAFNGIATSNYEISIHAKDGHKIDLVLNASPRHASGNKIVGAVCIGQDVTFLQRATTEFGLFLWNMNDIRVPYHEMSQDAQKSLSIVAGLIHDGAEESLADRNSADFCEWLKKEFGGEPDFDFVKMFEVQSGTVWLRLVGRKHGQGCKGYVLDVTNEHSALLKAKQVEHYLRIMSRQAFDLVLHVDSKSLVVGTVWDAKNMTLATLPKEGDDLKSLLSLDDAECREMTSAAMMSGSSLQTVTFGQGTARTPSQCLCIIEPDDPGMMIVAITSEEFRARRRPRDKKEEHRKGLMTRDLQKRSEESLNRSRQRRPGSLSDSRGEKRELESLPENAEEEEDAVTVSSHSYTNTRMNPMLSALVPDMHKGERTKTLLSGSTSQTMRTLRESKRGSPDRKPTARETTKSSSNHVSKRGEDRPRRDKRPDGAWTSSADSRADSHEGRSAWSSQLGSRRCGRLASSSKASSSPDGHVRKEPEYGAKKITGSSDGILSPMKLQDHSAEVESLGSWKVKGTFLEFEFKDSERQGSAHSRCSSAPASSSQCGDGSSSVQQSVPMTLLAYTHPPYGDDHRLFESSQDSQADFCSSMQGTSQCTSIVDGVSKNGASNEMPRGMASAAAANAIFEPASGSNQPASHSTSGPVAPMSSPYDDGKVVKMQGGSDYSSTHIAFLLKKWLTMSPDLHRLVDMLEQLMPIHLKNQDLVEQLEILLEYLQQRIQQCEIPLVNAKFDRQLGERLKLLLPTSLAAPGRTEWEDTWHEMRFRLVCKLMHAIVSDVRNAVPVVSAGARCNVLMHLLSCITTTRAHHQGYNGTTLIAVVRFVLFLFNSLLTVADGKVLSATARDRKKAHVATQVIQSSRTVAGCMDNDSWSQRVEILISMAKSKPTHVAAFLEDTIEKLLRVENDSAQRSAKVG